MEAITFEYDEAPLSAAQRRTADRCPRIASFKGAHTEYRRGAVCFRGESGGIPGCAPPGAAVTLIDPVVDKAPLHAVEPLSLECGTDLWDA